MNYVDLIILNKTGVSEQDVIGDIIHPNDAGAYFLGQGTYEIYYAIGKTFRPESILEIGVRFGYSLKSMMLGSDRVKKVYGFDNEYDLKGSLNIAKNNIEHLAGIELFLMNTQEVETLGLKDKVDLAHVDAWHTKEGCYHDCCLASQCLKNGGVLVVDDVGGEVREGADLFCKENNLEPQYLSCFTEMYVIPWIR